MPHSSPPARPKRLVVATGNPGKLREFRQLLAALPFQTIGQAELGVTAAEETGSSFLENALIKARHAAAATGEAAIADDSGLEVDALGGAPGIFSARYAGASASDAANTEKLLGELAGVPGEKRTARYRCVLVFVPAPPDSRPVIAEGVWEGRILEAPRGRGGFGYDPVFWLPDWGATAAEIDAAQKNRRSHRASAMARLAAQLAVHA
jgi:XTP/dITP diphosphohydrolase